MTLTADELRAELAPDEAVFGARNPQLLIRHDPSDILICFEQGEYRTRDAKHIEFLLGIVKAEDRGHKGIWVRHLPEPGRRPAQAAVTKTTSAAATSVKAAKAKADKARAARAVEARAKAAEAKAAESARYNAAFKAAKVAAEVEAAKADTARKANAVKDPTPQRKEG